MTGVTERSIPRRRLYSRRGY